MDLIDDFLSTYVEKTTKEVYGSHIRNYFKALDVDPDTYLDRFKEAKKSKDIEKIEDVLKKYEKDVRLFRQSLEGHPPLTIRNAISVVKMFLLNYDIDLKMKFWKKLSDGIKGSRARTKDTVPKREQLKVLLTHADSRGRALFLVLSSSGMRIGESCKITVDDVKLNETPVRIEILGEYTKSGEPRDVFISNEAKTAVQAWLKIRQKYIDSIYEHSKLRFKHYKIDRDDLRVFPFKPDAGRTIWNRLIKNSGFDEPDKSTGRYRMHVHTLRKYFRTNMSLKIPVDIIEAMMGHEAYLTSAYRRYSQEQLAEFYLKAMETISVYETPADLSRIEELEKQLKETKSELEKLKQIDPEDIIKNVLEKLEERK